MAFNDVIAQAIFKIFEPYLLPFKAQAQAMADEKTLPLTLSNLEQVQDHILYSAILGIEMQYEKDGFSLRVDPQIREKLLANGLLAANQIYQRENLQEILTIANEQLESSNTIPSSNVNPTWLSRFLDEARHISDEDVQALWGKILAGELSNPGKFSLSTLDKLRNFSKSDAQLVQKIERFCIRDDNVVYILHESIQYHISHAEVLDLIEVGVLHPTESTNITYKVSAGSRLVVHQGMRLIASESIRDKDKEMQLKVRVLTRLGNEILDLTNRVDPTPAEFGPLISHLKFLGLAVITGTYGYEIVSDGEGKVIRFLEKHDIVAV